MRISTRSSGPARDLWIEIGAVSYRTLAGWSRVPQGTCGLKSDRDTTLCPYSRSGPARDLWIEIMSCSSVISSAIVGSRKGPVD